MYWQFPAGSNNRLNENDNDRDNDNRVFDSQNNDRDGFNINHLEVYAGSELNLAWTLQHGCGKDSNVECQTIVQYACKGDDPRLGDNEPVKMRDGRVIKNNNNSIDEGEENDLRQGMHENEYNRVHCRTRERNQGLFPADQLNRNQKTTAIYTRQDNQGTKYAFECPEERDYYPYWTPTMWKDIVVQVDDPDAQMFPTRDDNRTVRQYFQDESENVQSRSYCYVPKATMQAQGFTTGNNNENYKVPINAEACALLAADEGNDQIKWIEKEKHGIPAPRVIKSFESRDNHHGNAKGSRYPETYKWTIPKELAGKECALRLRYNMSSPEIDNWNIAREHKILVNAGQAPGKDNTNPNLGQTDNTTNTNSVGPEFWEKYGMDAEQALYRGYKHTNDAQFLAMPASELRFQMSYNTDQLARTFQDRTYMIKIKARPANFPADAKIHNLGASGKAGSNVENYPNFEYDFHPQVLNVKKGDFVHIQFSGASNYDANNDGAITDELGRQFATAETNELGIQLDIAGKFRINMVPTKSKDSLMCDGGQVSGKDEKGKNQQKFLGITDDSLKYNEHGFTTAQDFLTSIAVDGIYGDKGNTDVYGKNQADENYNNENQDLKAFHVNFGLVEMSETGIWNYMSTHGQKFGGNVVRGTIKVEDEN